MGVRGREGRERGRDGFVIKGERVDRKEGIRGLVGDVEKVKGSVSRDSRPPVFFMIRTHLGP